MSARLRDVVLSGGSAVHDMRSERVRVQHMQQETQGPPSYIRITAGDKKVLMCKDTCTTIIQNNHGDCLKTVYPTLSTAYYNLVQLCQDAS
jgi:hypothetical protein